MNERRRRQARTSAAASTVPDAACVGGLHPPYTRSAIRATLAMMHIAEGRIGQTKRRIDAFLWFEGGTGRMVGAVINEADQERLRRLCMLLEIDPKTIR